MFTYSSQSLLYYLNLLELLLPVTFIIELYGTIFVLGALAYFCVQCTVSDCAYFKNLKT